MIHIRSASETDADAIADIWNYYISETTVTFNSVEKTNDIVKEAIKACDRDNRAFLVAEDGGNLLGFCTYFQFRGGIGYAKTMEHTILTHHQAKGAGIGRALMERLYAHAKAGGVKSL